MLSTNITHGDLQIDFNNDGSVQLTRKSNGNAIVLSTTEAEYIKKVWELHEWPIAPPMCVDPNIR
jgi:hypothetical protein